MPDKILAKASRRSPAGGKGHPKVADFSSDDSEYDIKFQRSASRVNSSTTGLGSEQPNIAEMSIWSGMEQASVDLQSDMTFLMEDLFPAPSRAEDDVLSPGLRPNIRVNRNGTVVHSDDSHQDDTPDPYPSGQMSPQSPITKSTTSPSSADCTDKSATADMSADPNCNSREKNLSPHRHQSVSTQSALEHSSRGEPTSSNYIPSASETYPPDLTQQDIVGLKSMYRPSEFWHNKLYDTRKARVQGTMLETNRQQAQRPERRASMPSTTSSGSMSKHGPAQKKQDPQSRRKSKAIVVKDLDGNILDLKKLAALSAPKSEDQPGILETQQPNLSMIKSEVFVCKCCPKRPRQFPSEEVLLLHEPKRLHEPKTRRRSEKQFTCQSCPKKFKTVLSRRQHQRSVHQRKEEVLQEKPPCISVSSTDRMEEHLMLLNEAQVKRLAKEREVATGVIEERQRTETEVERHCDQSEEASTTVADTTVGHLTRLLYDRALDVRAPRRAVDHDQGSDHASLYRFIEEENQNKIAAGGITSVQPPSGDADRPGKEMWGGTIDEWDSSFSPMKKTKKGKMGTVATIQDKQKHEEEERSAPTPFHQATLNNTSKLNDAMEVAIPTTTDGESTFQDESNVDYFNDWAKTAERGTTPQTVAFDNTSTEIAEHTSGSPSELPLFDSSQPGYEPTTTPETPTILRCGIDGCEAVYLGGDRSADLMRHKRQAHQGFYPQYICGDDTCGRVFRTLDSRLQHYESDHPYIAAELSSRLQILSTLTAHEPTAGVPIDHSSLSDVQNDMPEPFWYCCACGGGPHQYADPNCGDCAHAHCTLCQAVKQSYPYSYANLPPKTAQDASDTNSGGNSRNPKRKRNSWPTQESRYFFLGDDENNSSAASSYAASVASVFSVESLASSASELSKASGYSATQIATAAKVLMSIFLEDEVLLPLYQSAITNPSIGHDRLERNLRRLLKAYAKQVENEAGDHLEYLASQLVLVKARWLARSIVAKLQTESVNEPIDPVERDNESSEDEEESRPVNEAAFEDLVILREFLTKSHAFEVLRAQVHAFVLPKNPVPSHVEKSRQEEHDFALSGNVKQGWLARNKGTAALRSWKNWRTNVADTIDAYLCNLNKPLVTTALFYLLTEAMILATDRTMTAVGFLERPLQPEKVRLRWSCDCGETHYSDVKELRDGGVAELIAHMERSSGVKVSASPYRQHTGNQQYVVPRPGRWLRNGFAKFTSIFSNSKPSSCLPQHTNACSSSVSNASSTTISQPSMLHLLACMHHNRFRKVLQQDRIEAIKTDRALLCFMRQQHAQYRGRLLKFLSLKGVQGIYFVKFRLPLGGSVDVRHHDPCCLTVSTATQSGCECIPPKGKVEPSPAAEYRCIPGPPATYPPVPSEYLKSLFMCPTNVHEQDTWILNLLPKRICGELQGRAGQPAEGWGIYYQEGWDFDVIILLVFVVFVLASLLFGVLWSKFQLDVQGAFGVSAYIITASGILVAVFASRVGKTG